MISNSGHDERGKYSGGQAGDQTGGEWQIQAWYNRPWTHVFRYPASTVRECIASLAEEAAKNDRIGYDQNQRTTFWASCGRWAIGRRRSPSPAKRTAPRAWPPLLRRRATCWA